jgi:uncharacterized protein
MANEHPNAAAYRRTADAFRARDWDTIRKLVDDDVVWHVPGSHPLAGDVRGAEAVARFVAQVSELGITLREHDVIANDDHVCALSYMGARRPGVAIETRVVSVFHFRNGRQAERWFFPEDVALWDAIFAIS